MALPRQRRRSGTGGFGARARAGRERAAGAWSRGGRGDACARFPGRCGWPGLEHPAGHQYLLAGGRLRPALQGPAATAGATRAWDRATPILGLGAVWPKDPGGGRPAIPEAASSCRPQVPALYAPKAGLSQVSTETFLGAVTLCLLLVFEIRSFPRPAEVRMQHWPL